MSNDLTGIFGEEFNSNDYEPLGTFEAIPPGNYTVQIEKTELRTTKKGDGHYVWLEMVVLEGQYKGRKLWDQINIDNPSVKCAEMGRKAFGDLVRAAGYQKVSNTDVLLQSIVVAVVKVKDSQNEIRTYKSTNQGDLGQPQPPTGQPWVNPAGDQQAPQSEQAPQMPADNQPAVPPWMRQ